MSPADTPEARPSEPQNPVNPQRAIAGKLRAARKREFAMLRERMRELENTPSKVAGVRGRAARDQAANNQTLEKIERIGARLEALWNPAAASDNAPAATAALTTQMPDTVAAGANTSLMPSAWSDASVWAQPLTELLSLEPAMPMLEIPAMAPTPAQTPHHALATVWAQDPLMKEIAQHLAQQRHTVVQTLILAALDANKARDPSGHLQAQILLESYRLVDDVDAFDQAVLEYVHWWQGVTPQWQRRRGKQSGPEWVLQGRIEGTSAMALPELDISAQAQTIHIECSQLQYMDSKAAKALSQWLARASKRNYHIILEAPSAPLYLQWLLLEFEKTATLRTYF